MSYRIINISHTTISNYNQSLISRYIRVNFFNHAESMIHPSITNVSAHRSHNKHPIDNMFALHLFQQLQSHTINHIRLEPFNLHVIVVICHPEDIYQLVSGRLCWVVIGHSKNFTDVLCRLDWPHIHMEGTSRILYHIICYQFNGSVSTICCGGFRRKVLRS